MYGRDNESYASVARVLIGGFHGIDAIPEAWIQHVIDGNPEVDMHALGVTMTEQLIAQGEYLRSEASALTALTSSGG